MIRNHYPVQNRALLLLLSLVLLSAENFAADKRKQPNIILFLADDLGWTGLNCFGSDLYETPHLDKLAVKGIKFTNAYSACTVCSPSRAAIMTGKYPARLRVTDFLTGQNRPYAQLKIPDWQKWLPHSEVTIAELLKESGYRTAHVGKWHLDKKDAQKEDKDYGPSGHGFERQVLKPPAKSNYLSQPTGNFEEGDFITDYFANEASQIIEEWQTDPFFLHFAFHVPHTPIAGRSDYVEEFSRKADPNALHQNPHFAAMVKSMDDAVGRVIQTLAENKLTNDTLILFTSDNGGLTQRYGKLDGFTDNAPLRRGKGSAYEGGVRVPMIVSWPGTTPPGQICAEPVAGIDFFPTIAKVANIPGEQIPENIDGENLLPLFKNPQAATKRKELYWHYPHYHAGGDGPYTAVRKGKWRLIHFYETKTSHLYDLDIDLSETRDISNQNPEVLKNMSKHLETWLQNIDAQLPTPNTHHDPNRETEVAKKKRL